ncbi:hypothetical protein KJ978_02510, partial [Patescibacteria group bacterium]|nr:hypothetical protein [Patescibacteria group bacterium]
DGITYTKTGANKFTYSGSPSDYFITIDPIENFEENQVVIIVIKAQDQDSPANELEEISAFSIISSGCPACDSCCPVCPTNPQLVFIKTVEDLNKGELLPGDTILWTLKIINIGAKKITNILITDDIPAHSTYTAGSITGIGGDDSNLTQLIWNVSSLEISEEQILTFKVKIDANLADGTIISNQGFLSSDPLTLLSDDPTTPEENDPTEVVIGEEVIVINNPPQAIFIVNPFFGTVFTVFEFDASSSWDVEDSTSDLEVRWDFNNDGIWDLDWSQNKKAVYHYNLTGIYLIKLEVKDSQGLIDIATKKITVYTETEYKKKQDDQGTTTDERLLPQSYIKSDDKQDKTFFKPKPKSIIPPAAVKAVKVANIATLATAGIAAVAATVSVIPSIPALFALPLRLLVLLFGIFSKKRKPWGVVYDSVTKQPLDPVYVILRDKDGKKIDERITDMKGRFGFLVDPGKYYIEVKKTHYKFPSEKVGENSDEIYEHLYHGELLTITDSGAITLNIPMDSESFDWNEMIKHQNKYIKFNYHWEIFKRWLPFISFIFGFVLASIIWILYSTSFNFAIVLVFLILWLLRQLGFKEKIWGLVLDRNTKRPMPLALLKIFFAKTNQQIHSVITDIRGRYFVLLEPGQYDVELNKKQASKKYKMLQKYKNIKVKKGILNKDLWIDK